MKRLLGIIAYVLIAINLILGFGFIWIMRTWPHNTVSEMMYHMFNTSLKGTGSGIVLKGAAFILLPTMISLVLLFILRIKIFKEDKQKKYIICSWFLSLLFLCVVTILGIKQYKLNDYLKNVNSYSEFVDESYVEPKSVSITFPEKKRNLIYIFIESMEVTFTTPDHGGEFEMDLIPELEALASEGEDFSGKDEKLNGALATEMSTWTIAGMFAQTTGMPLKSDLEPNDTKQLKESFYSNITSLGDVLEKEGYKQYLLLGSDARFGGRKTYFSKHGNYNIHDYLYAVDNNYIPSDYYKWWGYEDEKLFDFAKKELTEISKTGEPFNYTLLTADTHPEDGYVCEKCGNEYDVQYANVIACSSKQVYDFVRWIQQQPFYENTTIVLCGDHPTMEADFCKGKKNRIHRKTYTCILNSAVTPSRDTKREYTTLDLFPTTLAAMGAEIEGDKLALGTNLYSDKYTLVELNNLDEINKALLSRSKLCEKLFYSEEEMDLDNPLLERTTEELLIPESAEEK